MIKLASNIEYNLKHISYPNKTSLENAYKILLADPSEEIVIPLLKIDNSINNRLFINTALNVIKEFLATNEKSIILVLEDESYITNNLSSKIDDYIDKIQNPDMLQSRFHMPSFMHFETKKGKTFQEMLFYYIDRNDLSDSDVYKSAYIDRKLFSKIRNNNEYQPSKNTVIALGIALRLNIDDLLDLLKSAGFTLSDSIDFDLIIQYMVTKKIYDRFEIDKALYSKCRKTL